MNRVYLSGPMTGYPAFNFPAFEAATRCLRAAGYEVISPHEIDLAEGFDPNSDGEDFDLRAALERDVEAVLACDGVVVLDGWEDSPGATIEVLVAASLAKPVMTLEEALKPPASEFIPAHRDMMVGGSVPA